MKESKYIYFEEMQGLNRKTKVFEVLSKNDNAFLGTIKWYPQWRQYCFFTTDNCIFNKECLGFVINFINQLMKEYKDV